MKELSILDQITQTKCHFRMQQWGNLIQDYQNSGLKLDEWCKQNHVTRNAYYYWLRKIREHACQTVSSVELPQVERMHFAKVEFENTNTISSAVVVHLPYATLEIKDGTSTQTIEAVITALKRS